MLNCSSIVSNQPETFTRLKVKRMLAISEHRLRAWEAKGFVPAAQTFLFQDVAVMRRLVALEAEGFKPRQMKEAIEAAQKRLGPIRNPLLELKLFRLGKRIGVQGAGYRIDPRSGQMLLDFDFRPAQPHSMPTERLDAAREQEKAKRRAEADHWFQTGLEAEHAAAPINEIVKAYQHAIELNPTMSPAMVNLGTLFFNSGYHKQAEDYYRRAVEVDPEYPLAHFNLANLFDDRGDRAKALFHYLAALKSNPRYADAHYNLALLYQTMGETMKALRHWKTYLKLDPGSNWASIARREMRKLKDATVIAGAGRPQSG
ncbi:MAG: tetratricopeptide repeat protein [Bryobacteraceae bacterium]|nr:tetratricopeptide repeat protein [Bryobacteraceae bacterium]